jgi:HNH endonuclease
MSSKRIVNNDLARFAAGVMHAKSGCLLWTKAKDRYGYGRTHLRGRVEKAHRAAWTLHRGPIPRGMWVLHHCDTPACVNVEHLFLGDRAANMQDMAAKGRQVFQANPSKINRGEHGPGAVLTEAQALSILARLKRGERGAALAREFGVSKPTISAMNVGRTWRHLQRAALDAF